MNDAKYKRRCPVCGDIDELLVAEFRADTHLWFQAVCPNCGKTGPKATSGYDAVVKWSNQEERNR